MYVSVCWRQVKTSRQLWQETMIFDNGRVGQAFQADGTHPFVGKGTISQTPILCHDVARVVDEQTRRSFNCYYTTEIVSCQ